MTSNRKSLPRRLTGLFIVALLPIAVLSGEAMASDFEKPVFEFQSKLANQGNAKAQYFLAQMYEEGRGTKVDADLAKHWYEQARINGYTPERQNVASN